jgi:translation initiation factor 4G
MSEADVKRQVEQDVKEFMAIRNMEEGENYWTKLPEEHRFRLVDKLVTFATESKEADAQLVGDFFALAVAKSLCSPAAFEQGFEPTVELLDDIVIDAPKALDLMAIMLRGAGLDEERRKRLASKSMDGGDKLLSLIS